MPTCSSFMLSSSSGEPFAALPCGEGSEEGVPLVEPSSADAGSGSWRCVPVGVKEANSCDEGCVLLLLLLLLVGAAAAAAVLLLLWDGAVVAAGVDGSTF